MLVGDKVNLRPVDSQDLPIMVEWRNKPRILNNLFSPYPVTLTQQEKWFHDYINRGDERLFIIETKDSRRVGTVGISKIDHRNQSAEFGRLMIGEDEELAKGYALDATLTLLKFAFRELNLNRIWLEVFAQNEVAIGIYTECGFRQEGTKREAVFAGGRFQDVAVMSILAREFWMLNGAK